MALQLHFSFQLALLKSNCMVKKMMYLSIYLRKRFLLLKSYFKVSSPEVLSSFINRLTMWWFNELCRLGVKKPLEPSDLYSLNDDDSSTVLVPRWSKLWEKKLNGKKRSF
ncbi:hypothetical protein NECAME_08708, partial [Necator americanus]